MGLDCIKSEVQDTPGLTRYECKDDKFKKDGNNIPKTYINEPLKSAGRGLEERISEEEAREKVGERILFPNVSDISYKKTTESLSKGEISPYEVLEQLESENSVRDKSNFPGLSKEYYDQIIGLLDNGTIDSNKANEILSSRDYISRRSIFPNVGDTIYSNLISRVDKGEIGPYEALLQLTKEDLEKKRR